jgi:photosystem II stability/assembly factor-like uncharacterized protein
VRPRTFPALVATLAAAAALNGAAAPAAEVLPASGPVSATTMQRLLLVDAARVGNRIVAVGDRGYIVYSDDDGASWKRAKAPAAPLLTALEFVDARNGFAVGHDSVILATTDGGETWSTRFSAPDEHRPLLDVAFVSASQGYAVGAYAAFYETADGGRSWTARKIIEDDKHLNALVPLGDAALMILGEAGTILASNDGGKSWESLPAPYKGSFFGGVVADDGSVVAFGLRGRIFRSSDRGRSWTQVENASAATLMGGSKLQGGEVVLAGAAGTVLVSRDHGRTVAPLASGTTRALAKAVAGAPGGLVVIGEAGVRSLPLPPAPR